MRAEPSRPGAVAGRRPAAETPVVATMLRPDYPIPESDIGLRRRRLTRTVAVLWRRRVLRGIDRPAVTARVKDDDGLTGRFAVMTLLSAGIAVLGLLLSSPAVVIGAMLISPLMGPILGLGFALAASDVRETRRSLFALGAGTLIAVAFCALIVLASPLKAVTPEILARTRPNLFDLLVAIFSAIAGTYAMIRGRGGTIVGVAIATALMPPLATIGYGLATGNRAILIGAAALFATNAVAIAFTAATIAKLYGFGTDLAHPSTRMQTLILLGVFAALSVPLGLSLRSIAWETYATGEARRYLARYFGADTRVTQLDIDFGAQPVVVRAVVLTDRFKPGARQEITKGLSRDLGRAIEVRLNEVVTNRGASALEQEARALGASRAFAAQTAAAATQPREADDVAAEIAAVTGAETSAIDADAKRAQIAAPARAGTTLAGWRAAEATIRARHPGWTVTITPPLAPLPLVDFAPGEFALDAAAAATVETIAWATRRWRAGDLAVIGRAASRDDGARASARALAAKRADAIVAALSTRGIAAQGRVDAIGPRQRAAEREKGLARFRSAEITVAGAPPRLP